MEYEIHITVETKDKLRFVEDCKFIGAKAIVIEAADEEQVMTSSKHNDSRHEARLFNMCHSLKCMGYKILREKIEIKPGDKKNENFVYYESHFRFKIKKCSVNLEHIKDLITKNNFHVSRNLFKADSEYIYQMATYRSTEKSFFNTIRDAEFIFRLYPDLFELDKVEIEECIHDTNTLIDKKWLS